MNPDILRFIRYLGFEEYAHRCEEDTKINWMLWKKMERRLKEIYGN